MDIIRLAMWSVTFGTQIGWSVTFETLFDTASIILGDSSVEMLRFFWTLF